jgi:hypothetical protein
MYKKTSKKVKKHLPHSLSRIILAVVFFSLAAGLALAVRTNTARPTIPEGTILSNEVIKEWDARIKEEVATKGIDGALEMLGELDGQGGGSGQLCHDLTHLIGQRAYQMFMRGKDFEVTRKAQYCSFGFFHGVIEALVAATGDARNAREFCDFLATQKDFAQSDATYHCYHGIGHGAVNPHDPALWGDAVKMVTPALALCSEVAQNDEQRIDCGTGVFAGIAIFYTRGEYGLSMDPIAGDPFWLCRQVPEEYRESCYRDMHTVAGAQAGGDFRKAAAFYEAIPEDEYAIAALRSLGVPLEEFRAGAYPYAQGLAICRSLQTRLQDPCIQTIVRELIQKGKIGEELVEAQAFCEQPQLSADEKDACFEWLVLYVRWYDEDKAQVFCNSLDTKYREGCKDQITTR